MALRPVSSGRKQSSPSAAAPPSGDTHQRPLFETRLARCTARDFISGNILAELTSLSQLHARDAFTAALILSGNRGNFYGGSYWLYGGGCFELAKDAWVNLSWDSLVREIACEVEGEGILMGWVLVWKEKGEVVASWRSISRGWLLHLHLCPLKNPGSPFTPISM